MHCSRRTYRVKYTAALDNQIDFNHVARKGLGDTPAASVLEAGFGSLTILVSEPAWLYNTQGTLMKVQVYYTRPVHKYVHNSRSNLASPPSLREVLKSG